MRIAVIIGGTTIAMVSAGLLWQAQPSKRVLLTNDHPAIIELELPPNASAEIYGGLPVGSTVNVLGEHGELNTPPGYVSIDGQMFPCDKVTIGGKQYDCR